jgi:hypothetical protein
MKQSTCQLELVDYKINLVEKLKNIPGIVFVDFNNSWKNWNDTVVFYLTRPLSNKNIETLICLKPDECDTMKSENKTLWRLWWD